jgi:hypothetical protein
MNQEVPIACHYPHCNEVAVMMIDCVNSIVTMPDGWRWYTLQRSEQGVVIPNPGPYRWKFIFRCPRHAA